MHMPRRKLTVFCVMMMLNIFICILMGMSWNLRHVKSVSQKVESVTIESFPPLTLSKSFWNKEQQILDFIYEHYANSVHDTDSLVQLAHRLNYSVPLNPCEPDYRVRTQVSDYNSLPQSFQDFLLHMRCRTYPMLINQPHVCKKKPFLLLVIKSLIPHFDRRQAIRETWGRAGVLANRTVATVFLLGNTLSVDHYPNLQGLLGYEAQLHKDLLQWDYRDTFFNLTLKEVLFLEWFSQNCPHAQYVFKGDDDVFVNTLEIIKVLEGLSENKVKDLFIGDVISKAGPHRDRRLKYFIPESVFVGPYPPYAGGGGYLYSGAVALRLYDISRQVVSYPIDDVYTGMCLKKLGLVPEKHNGFRTFDIEHKYRNIPCIYRSFLVIHSRTPQEMLTIWPFIIHPELVCQ